MKSTTINQEESLDKLISILKIVELDFECLSCDKIKTDFLEDLTTRLQKKILNKESPNSNTKKEGKPIFFMKYEEWRELRYLDCWMNLGLF